MWIDSVITIKRDCGDISKRRRPTRRMRPLTGGTAITEKMATDLRKVVFGSTYQSFSADWRRACFTFRHVESHLPFGLEGARNGSRGVITCVQGYVLKYLLFEREKRNKDGGIIKVLFPSHQERRTGLAHALTRMLWKAGSETKAVVALPKDICGFDSPQCSFRQDGLTEMLWLWEFTTRESLLNFITKQLEYFETEENSGCCLFLYSMILGRTTENLWEDFGKTAGSDQKLLDDSEDPNQCLINFMLSGRAVPHLHNGLLVYDEEGRALRRPQQGIHTRSDVGFFIWSRVEVDHHRTEVGSMLRTPRTPIWVTMVNGQYGVLFSTNMNLMIDWRVEHRFNLHYYTIKSSQVEDAVLSVDTRFGTSGQKGQQEEKRRLPPLEQCIRMKWADSQVIWNGTTPFI